MSNEVFCEMVRMKRVQDVAAYVRDGAPVVEYTAPMLGLYRARYRKTGVQWEFLASLSARIINTEVDHWGREICVLACRGANGAGFLARVPKLVLYSGKAHHNRAVYSAFICSRGFIGSGSFILPGALAATVRAIIQLSEDGEPMPLTPDEFAALDGLETDSGDDSLSGI